MQVYGYLLIHLFLHSCLEIRSANLIVLNPLISYECKLDSENSFVSNKKDITDDTLISFMNAPVAR